MREILYYLTENPDAMDTVQGILNWWMPKGYRRQGGKEIQVALDSLVYRGWLMPRPYNNGHPVYGVNKARLKQIKEFLRGI